MKSTTTLKKILLLPILFFSSTTFADIFTVTNIQDDDAGSLRQAIMAMNTACNGNDIINFNIPQELATTVDGLKLYSIKLDTPLPIIHCKVDINGYSQPGATVGQPVIEINGENLFSTIDVTTPSTSGNPSGLVLVGRDRTTSNKLPQAPDGSIIRGLIINKFPLRGIHVYGTDNVTIVGNYIGIDITGEKPGYANKAEGILLEGSQDNYIGTTKVDYDANVINANNRNIVGSAGKDGIFLVYLNDFNFVTSTSGGTPDGIGYCETCQRHPEIGSKGNIIQGNYVGLNKEGNCVVGGFQGTTAGLPGSCKSDGTRAAVPVGGNANATSSVLGTGIRIERGLGSNFNPPFNANNNYNEIGGLGAGQGNVVAGMGGHGIYVNSPYNKIQGNLVGMNSNGINPLQANMGGQVGILIAAHGHDIVIEGNTITRTLLAGVAILELAYHPGPHNILVTRNNVGTNSARSFTAGSLFEGIFIGSDVQKVTISHNTITGSVLGSGISIRPRNRSEGPDILPLDPVWIPKGITILSNSIYQNGRLGIDLVKTPFNDATNVPHADGVLENDHLDLDEGVNNQQNYPVLNGERSFSNPALVQVWGSLHSKPNKKYLVQIFSNKLADPSGNGEGELLIGEIQVDTNSAGNVNFHVPAALNVPVGYIITATATDLETGDTSEFSKWINVDPKGNPTAYEAVEGAAKAGEMP